MTALQIAPVVHEALRALQRELGQPVTPSWDEATWERESTIEAVTFAMNDPRPGQQHNHWMNERLNAGWVFGEAKDNDKKTSPFLVPFEELPAAEKAKDELVIVITRLLQNVTSPVTAASH